MTSLSIKDVPSETADRLRDRAARNFRSLQGELLAIIEAAANDDRGQLSPPAPLARLNLTALRPRPAPKTVEQIAAELRELFPAPAQTAQRSVDIVRELRDSR
ncbi:MAG: hypothetical protein ABI589_01260 [Burkholderiales bacterium]